MPTANVQIRKILVGRGNTTVSSSYSGARGEITMDTDLNTLRVHDGVTVGGIRLATYSELANVSVGNLDLSGYATTAQITAANANAATQATSINSINANVGAYQIYANANAATQTTEINALRANITAANTAITALQSNAAVQQALLDTLTSNAATQSTVLDTLTSNAATQANTLTTLLANAVAQQTSLIDLVANAATQAQLIANAGGTYSNANVASYLSVFNGNIIPSANVTYSLGDATHQWKDLWVSNNTIYISNIPISVSANGSLLVNGAAVSGGSVSSLVNGSYTATLNSSGHLELPSDRNIMATGLGLRGDVTESYTYLQLPSDADSATIPVHIANDNGNVDISAVMQGEGGGTYHWTFDNTGKLTLPQGSQIVEKGAGMLELTAGAGPGSYASLASFDGNTYMWVDNTAAYIGTNWILGSKTWTFDNNGDLTVPESGFIRGTNDLTIQSLVSGNHSGVFFNGNPMVGTAILYAHNGVTIRSDYDGAEGGAKDWTFDQFGTLNFPDGFSTIETNSGDMEISAPGNISIINTGGGWTFHANGQLQTPDTIFVSNGVSVMDANGVIQGGIYSSGDADFFTIGASAGRGYKFYVNEEDVGPLFYANGDVSVPGTITAPVGNIGDVGLYGGTIYGTNPNWNYLTLASQVEGYSYVQIPADTHANIGNLRIHNDVGNVEIGTGDGVYNYTWSFDSDGTTRFPTLTVNLHNGGNQSAQTLQFGDPTQQAVITGPAPIDGLNAQRLIIQGQNGGLGEGGDVYIWAGDADINGGDIKIYAGDADNPSLGYGGYINLDGGSGFEGGGYINITGGTSSSNSGGTVTVAGGSGAAGAPLNLQAGNSSDPATPGGTVYIQGGYGGTDGGTVSIQGGISALGLQNYGNVLVGAGSSTWTFDNTGNLIVPNGITMAAGSGRLISVETPAPGLVNWEFGMDGNLTIPGNINYANGVSILSGLGGAVTGNIVVDYSEIQFVANSSGDGYGLSTIRLIPYTAGYDTAHIIIDPTYPNHIHVRAGGEQDNSTANLFLGGEASHFNVEEGANPNVSIRANHQTWHFASDGTYGILTLPPGEGQIRAIDDTINLQTQNSITGNINSLYLGSSGGVGFFDQSIGGNWLEIFRSGSEPQIRTMVGNIYVQTTDGMTTYDWTFANTGILHLPNGGKIDTSVAGLPTVVEDPDGVLLLSGLGDGISVGSPGNNSSISVNANIWIFDTEGSLYFPSGGSLVFDPSNVSTIDGVTNINASGTVGANVIQVLSDITSFGASPAPTIYGFRSISTTGSAVNEGNISASGNLVASQNAYVTGNVFAASYNFANGVNILDTISGVTSINSVVSTSILTDVSGDYQYGTLDYSYEVNGNNGQFAIQYSFPLVYGNVDVNVGNVIASNVTTTNGIFWANGQAYSTGGGGGSYGNTEVAAYLLTGINSSLGTLVATNFSAANARITGGSITGATGAFTTLQVSNFSSANVFITGAGGIGYAQNNAVSRIGNVYSTYANFTNFSTANAIVTGGSITGVTGAATTWNATNFSSSNIAVTGGYLEALANVTATGNITTTANVYAANLIGYGSNTTIIAGSYTTQFLNNGQIITDNIITTARPAFRAYGSGVGSGQTTANVNLKGSTLTVDYNQGNYFNANTGVFTASVPGLYQTTLVARVSDNNGLNQIAVLRNGSFSGANVVCFWETDTNTGTATHFGTSGVIKLTAGDFLSANILTGNVTFDQNDSWTITYIG